MTKNLKRRLKELFLPSLVNFKLILQVVLDYSSMLIAFRSNKYYLASSEARFLQLADALIGV